MLSAAGASLDTQLLAEGMIFALALLNCILGATLHDGIYLWYASALFAFVLAAALPPGVAATAATVAFFGLAVVFSRAFLDLPRVAPALWRASLVCFVLVAAEKAAYAFVPRPPGRAGLEAAVDPLATTLLLLVMFYAGIVAWRRGNALARFYALGFAGLLVGLTINLCGSYGVIPRTAGTDAANAAGVAWEALFLSAALADRIRGLDRRAATLQGERDALEVVALHDALTRIANRRSFELRLEEEWRRGTRTQTALAVILIDVDHFKRYNDALGHPRGDRALRRVARAIDGVLRRPEDLVARYGGEEFVAVLPNCARGDAARIADQMRAAVRRLRIPHPGSTSGILTISAGVASAVPRHIDRPAVLVSAADRALYAAKREGRDRSVTA